MEKTGLIVFPSDGGKHFLLNEECKLLTKLITIKQKQKGSKWNIEYQYKHFIPNADKYELVIVPRCSCLYFTVNYMAGGGGGVAGGGHIRIFNEMCSVPITKFDIQGEHIVWEIDKDVLYEFLYMSEWVFDNEYIIDVYGYKKNQLIKNNFGLDFKAADQFLTVSDEKEIGYCILREKIKMSAGQSWSVPLGLPNPENHVVFVRSDNPNCAVSTDRIYNKITVSHDCNLYIVVFSSGFTPQKDDCGLHIWNEQGELTYSSRYIPFFQGENIIFNNHTDVVTTTLQSPMIRATDLFLLWDKSGNDWDYYATAYKFTGNKITITKGIKIGNGNIGPQYDHSLSAAIPTYAIEFSNYF
ncbi:DUF6453 family protein [Xenorhabdus szentirmaii]|uniref:Uncharacterized protein n=1 Tax=Xenorhabdus szentirmaii DSM 16338 TaxID=1427518 RepID=W1ITS0_9GAMM|nr:DUF6453 family protein [Xenorhabdus szentirmaii]PHM30538.1 hypothetical protein Xsze_04128 [Xenorhabdus szentirmaii DSM 16338]CDL80996.1 hypothetical protein XSR1_100046 [Xenorhabdus szentirmaii DSM 16338]